MALEFDTGVQRVLRNPIAALAADRPALVLALCFVAAGTVGALAFRGAPPTAVATSLAYPAVFLFGLAAPALVGAMTPAPLRAGLASALIAAILIAGVVAAPALSERAVEASGGLIDPIGMRAGMRLGLMVLGVFLLGGALVRADRGHLPLLVFAAVIGLAVTFAVAEIEQGAANRGPADISVGRLVLGGVAALQLAAFVAGRFAEALADGKDDAGSASDAVGDGAPFAAFLAIAMIAALALDRAAGVGVGAALIDAGVAVIPPLFAVLFLGGAGLALVGGGDEAVVAANRRRDAAAQVVRRVRRYLGVSACLSTMAVAGVVAVVAALDRPAGPDPNALFGAALAAGAAAIAFVSLRAGVALGALLTVVATIVPWAAGPFLPEPTQFETMAAMILAAGLLAPSALAWRERRNPWRKSREVWMTAAQSALGPTIAAATFTLAGLWAAAAFDIWPEAVRVLVWTVAYGAVALALSPAWLIGFGAAIGRGE
ncbi:MAG: hypothetical protein AAFX08_12570 [Pseudomonadota bacterium]